MARDEDERQRVIREDRMRKGKAASTASAQKEKVDQNPYVPKTRKRRDARPGVESSQPHMDYSSQPEDEVEDEEVAGDAEVPEDFVADYMEAENVIPEGEPEPQTQRKKMKELGKPEAGLRWFWEPVEGYGLHDLIYTGYSTVTHAMIRAMCERWHTETNSFHLPVWEMTITLDDVHNLLHIPIHSRMLDHDEAMSQERVIDLMTRLLGMSDVDARSEIRTESAGHISYPTLKRVYEDHLTEARRLDDPQTREELQERARRRQWCVRSFLLYLVGCAMFTNKTNRHIDLIYLDCMADLQAIGKWSWGGMALAYLFDYVDDSVILNNRTMAGSTTLFMVDDVRFSTYGDHRVVHPFQLIVTYSGWLMCGKDMVYRHLPERVKMQLFYVQDVSRHPSSVAQVPTHDLTTVLQNAQAWFFTAWGDACERPWHHVPGYMVWYAKVSHPRILPPDEGSPPRPANVEQIIEEEHAREMPDTLTIIRDVVHIVGDIVARQAEMTKEEIVQ
uniref:IMP dehydrogenase/GMP reductase, related n=1 Tax=Medicago truncatula TaxID=3880 RepID=A2Q323_MEDTR|nr:IMP dehydrogenase/GMP reductase, related [Medicago truncatula]